MKRNHSTADPSTAPPLLTNEAARILNVTPETIRHWERNGRLPAVKTERGVRLFDRRDVLALKARREQDSITAAASAPEVRV
jgi:excisionase family DNA binding protein